MTDTDLRAEYNALPPAARRSATNHPHLFYATAAIECLFFAGLGVWLMTRSIVGGVLVVAVGILAALFTAWPGYWSERHPEQARRAVEIQRARRNRLARRHPAYFIVFVPLLTAASATLRFNGRRHHHSTADWVVPAVLGLAFGLTVGAILVYRAHHARAAAALQHS